MPYGGPSYRSLTLLAEFTSGRNTLSNLPAWSHAGLSEGLTKNSIEAASLASLRLQSLDSSGTISCDSDKFLH
jgi:hypothetical protein